MSLMVLVRPCLRLALLFTWLNRTMCIERRGSVVWRYLDEHGEYERGVFNLLHGVGADGGVIYEVGARAGEHTSLFHSSATSYDGIIAWVGMTYMVIWNAACMSTLRACSTKP